MENGPPTTSWKNSVEKKVARLASEYAAAEPFPHAVIDGFLPRALARRVSEELGSMELASWQEFSNKREIKKATVPGVLRNLCGVKHEAVIDVLRFLATDRFCQSLTAATGIENIIPDPMFRGGGVHRIERGGRLDVHTDFNRGPYGYRRLNLLLYMNLRWRESYGGHLQLVDGETRRVVRSVLPGLNRAVLFTASDSSWHGHPVPLTCPPHRARMSLASYYYTAEKPGDFSGVQGTTFLEPR